MSLPPKIETKDFANTSSSAEKGEAPPPSAHFDSQQTSGLSRRKDPSGTTASPMSTAGRTNTWKTGTTATVINTPTTPLAMNGGAPPNGSAVDAPLIVPHSKLRLSYWKTLLKPPKPVGKAPSAAQSLRAIVFASWLNLLLVFIPVSWALHFAINNDTVIFVTAFLAIIPLAKLLGFATEEMSLRVGETLGGLLNATLGNAVELIISIIALTKCQLRVVQASLIGSILSNLLLVLGMCFFAGGTKFATQGFLISASQLNSSLLTLSVVAVLIPATFHAALSDTTTTDTGTITPSVEGQKILQMSRGVSVILLFIYGCNLTFQLWSHAHLYDNKEPDAVVKSEKYPESVHLPRIRRSKENVGVPLSPSDAGHGGSVTSRPSTPSTDLQHLGVPHPDGSSAVEPNGRASTGSPALQVTATNGEVSKKSVVEDDVEEPQISVWAAVILLVVVTVLVAFTAEFLVSSIDGLVANTPLSQEWVGLILLPIVGNAAEHVTAVSVSVKDKLDLSIGVAVGSSIQISLLVIPFIVVLGWIIGKPLTLLFDPFEAVVLFLTVITVNYVVADGQSNWLEGMILMCLYIIIAVALWFYPGSDPASALLTCT